MSRRSVGLDERDEQQNAEGKGYQELEQLFTTRGESALKTPEECSAGLGADDSRRTFRLLLMACALPPAGGLLVLVLVRAAPLALPGRRRVPEGARAASVRLLVSVRFGVVGARGGDAAARADRRVPSALAPAAGSRHRAVDGVQSGRTWPHSPTRARCGGLAFAAVAVEVALLRVAQVVTRVTNQSANGTDAFVFDVFACVAMVPSSTHNYRIT